MEKHIAIYVRVSTQSQNTESQEPDLQRYAAGQTTPVKWYHDQMTGRTMDRPGWNDVQQAIMAGEVSAVVVWRLDRLGRTAKGLTALFEQLREQKVNLVSLRDGVDLQTPAGRLMANVLASVAQFEREVIAERILAGQARARAKGKRWGGSPKGRRWKVTDEQIAVIRQLRGQKTPIAAIARAVNLRRATIYEYL